MKVSPHAFRRSLVVPLLLAWAVAPATAQSNAGTSTLRYGTGLFDVPVATVLPHLAVVATYSGASVSVDRTLRLDPDGSSRGYGAAYERWLADASFAVGLFDRVEAGVTVHHWDDAERGGRVWGGFGRVSLLPAAMENLDLAIGARYLTSPNYGEDYVDDLQPNRFGYPDYRLRESADFSGNLTPYVVATAAVPALRSSVSLGWGAGLFSAGSDLDFYQSRSSGGVFAGYALHVPMGEGRRLDLMADFNGFDFNAGVQIDVRGIRAGAFALGLTHDNSSIFLSRKIGVLGSIAFCGAAGRLCGSPPPLAPPPPPPARDPGPSAEEIEAMRQDSIRRAQAERERQLAAEREAEERERRRTAERARTTLAQVVYFDYDEALIRPDAEATLRAKVEILRANPSVNLRLEGHADERGTSEYNIVLAGERAAAVVEFFTAAGLAPDRFTTISYGEENPVALGSNEADWAQNRRVETTITAGGDDIGR